MSKKIKDLDEFLKNPPDEIIKAINEHRFIIFYGSGISRLVGIDTYYELNKKLIDNLIEINIIPEDYGESLKNQKDNQNHKQYLASRYKKHGMVLLFVCLK